MGVKRLFFVLVLLLCAFQAHAELPWTDQPFDTGTGNQYIQSPGGSKYWSAGKFELDQAYTLDSITGYIRVLSGSNSYPGIFDIVIYDPAVSADLPGLEKYRGSFELTANDTVNAWRGISGLDWELSAGTYWVAFEALSTTVDSRARMARLDTDSPHFQEALLKYVAKEPSHPDVWAPTVDDGFAVRMTGNPVVPEPLSMFLFGLGGIGLVAGRFHKKK